MDITISGGDVFLNAAGGTEYLSGVEEAAQRVRIAASMAKGAFIYNRSLGTDYHALGDSSMLTQKLDMLIREAAAGVAGTDVCVTDADAEEKTAAVRVTHGGETITTEVNLNGNI